MSSQVAALVDDSVMDPERGSPADAVRHTLPEGLALLLGSRPVDSELWASFVAAYTPLLLHVVKSSAGTRDERMDAYARVIEALRCDDCRRLRGYAATPHSKFTTWLVVVAKRICIDHHRSRFGRIRAADNDEASERRATRRRIEDLVAAAVDPENIAIEDYHRADSDLLARELRSAVAGALCRLTAEDRLLLALRFRDNLSSPEIARVVRGKSALSVYRRLEKILEALRATLKTRGIDGMTP